mmetsp:Transcript_10717/g.31934  ORF Transcript_10717/g.31934 Transcript_10717/m.31934 type:complete len:550 (+) Transcript_10717:100-1749(+)
MVLQHAGTPPVAHWLEHPANAPLHPATQQRRVPDRDRVPPAVPQVLQVQIEQRERRFRAAARLRPLRQILPLQLARNLRRIDVVDAPQHRRHAQRHLRVLGQHGEPAAAALDLRVVHLEPQELHLHAGKESVVLIVASSLDVDERVLSPRPPQLLEEGAHALVAADGAPLLEHHRQPAAQPHELFRVRIGREVGAGLHARCEQAQRLPPLQRANLLRPAARPRGHFAHPRSQQPAGMQPRERLRLLRSPHVVENEQAAPGIEPTRNGIDDRGLLLSERGDVDVDHARQLAQHVERASLLPKAEPEDAVVKGRLHANVAGEHRGEGALSEAGGPRQRGSASASPAQERNRLQAVFDQPLTESRIRRPLFVVVGDGRQIAARPLRLQQHRPPRRDPAHCVRSCRREAPAPARRRLLHQRCVLRVDPEGETRGECRQGAIGQAARRRRAAHRQLAREKGKPRRIPQRHACMRLLGHALPEGHAEPRARVVGRQSLPADDVRHARMRKSLGQRERLAPIEHDQLGPSQHLHEAGRVDGLRPSVLDPQESAVRP